MIDESIIYLWGGVHSRLRIHRNEVDNVELLLEENTTKRGEPCKWDEVARIPLDRDRIEDIIAAIREHTGKP